MYFAVVFFMEINKVEATLMLLCSYFTHGNSRHCSCRIPSKVPQLAVATAVLRNLRPICSGSEESGCVDSLCIMYSVF